MRKLGAYSAKCLELLVYLASVRRSVFSTNQAKEFSESSAGGVKIF